MIYTIIGEQPFQVLAESFSVSPSESGYDLYLSADGHNYSKFATVAANTTRQFTGMNEGNYYKLSGNTSTVKVNWMKDCGGGGGGGTAGVSSLDGQTGALTTKTINGNAILGSGDIEIGEGKTIVNLDELTQVERAALYTELWAVSGSANELYEFYAKFEGIECNTPIEIQAQDFNAGDYGGSIWFAGNSTIRQDNGTIINYRLTLLADGSIEQKVGAAYGVAKTIASSNTLGEIKVGSGLTIDQDGVLSVSGGSSSGPIVIDFDSMTQQERADLATELNALESGGSGDTINKTYQFYRTINSNWVGLRIQYYRVYFGRCVFGAVVSEIDAQSHIAPAVYEINMWLSSDGSWEATNVYKILGEQTKYIDNYLQGGLSKFGYDLTTSAFTAEQDGVGTVTVTGSTMLDAIVYWDLAENQYWWDEKWIYRLTFRVVDENSNVSYYSFPSISAKPASVTISGETFTKEMIFDYGTIAIRFYANGDPKLVNPQFIQKY